MFRKTTSRGLKEHWDTPQVPFSSAESFNATTIKNNRSPVDVSKPLVHSGCGCNSHKGVRISEHNVFVLGVDGVPLTPTTNAKARRLLKGKQAKPVWSKFGVFGIQMLVETNHITPKVVLGVDLGTKYEGYSVVSGCENLLNVMWLLPDKKNIVRKLEERRRLRRARRWRNCRRRQMRFNNRSRLGFVAPSQLLVVRSRLKALNEFFRCFPVSKVALEDVKFNHKYKRWGSNFSTVEVGKSLIKDFVVSRVGRENYVLFDGFETKNIRGLLGLKKSSNKSLEGFSSHCVDSFCLAYTLSKASPNFSVLVVDDSYRPVRRKLYDTQPKKNNIREKYSCGSFKGVRKGCLCNFGQVVGGTKNSFFVRDFNNKRVGRSKLSWVSHNFKVKRSCSIPPTIKTVGFLEHKI